MLTRRLRVAALLVAAACQDNPSPRIPDDPVRVARASSAAPDGPAELAVDGRARGGGPYAWRAAPADPAPWWQAEWDGPVTLASVRITLAPPASSARVVVSDDRGPWPSPPVDGGAGTLVATGPGRATRALRVSIEGAGAGGAGIAEVDLREEGQAAWLVEGPDGSDWEAELLAAAGVIPLARTAAAAAVPVRAPRASVVFVAAGARLDADEVGALRGFAAAGGRVVELGPGLPVCGPPEAASDPGPGRVVLAPPDGEGAGAAESVRWPGARVAATGPAIVRRAALGAGDCLRWLGDVAAVVRRLRQGDPRRADRDVDGSGRVQPADLFAGDQAPGDADVPDADVLAFHLAAQAAAAPRGLPVVGTLPGLAPALLVLTADQDFAPSAGIVAQSDAAPAGGLSVLLTDGGVGGAPDIRHAGSPAEASEPAVVARLAAREHDAGIHPNLQRLAVDALAPAVLSQARRFAERYGRPPRLSRNHHLRWHGAAAMARALVGAGVRMDLTFAALAEGGGLGFLAASGLPMRFVDDDGAVLPLFQQPTHLDDHLLIPGAGGATGADRFARRSIELLDAAAARWHVPLVVNHHPLWWYETGGAYQRLLLSRAEALGVPVWSAGRWLDFSEARRGVRILLDAGGAWEIEASRGDLAVLVPAATCPPAPGGGPTVRLGGMEWARLPVGGVERAVLKGCRLERAP